MRLFAAAVLGAAALGGATAHKVCTVMTPMRDGVRLAADVYLPAAQGRFPVLVTRTPYNKAGCRREAIYYAEHGYAVVAQDVRGRFASEGEFYAFLNEGRDGYDTIEWAAAQPWSNGKVGTFGASYLAWDQYHAAMYRPPHLVAMFANVGGANFYDEFGWPGGAPNLGWAIWILKSAETSQQAAQSPPAREPLSNFLRDPAPWLAQKPSERARVFDAFPAHRRMYDDFYSHPRFDGYWKQRGFFTAGYYREMKDVPVFFISGWYDYFAEGVIGNFMALNRRHKSEKKLWMGPWPHGIGADRCGDASFGPEAAVKVEQIALDWFDHWMKGAPYRVIGAEAVRYFRMGGGDGTRDEHGKRRHGGSWETANQWPPPGATIQRWYAAGSGELRLDPPGGERPSEFDYDPAHPVPTIGGRFGIGPWTPNCAQDQVCATNILGCEDNRPLSARADVLSFSSQPLSEPVDLTGRVMAHLWVSSDAPSVDFTAKLMDVYPDGYALILSDGQLRLAVSPRTPRRITVDLGSTSNRFARGHRIRLDLSSSNYPRVEPNPNRGHNRIYHDKRHATTLELPVMKTH
jgi:putative CocE/NonD family hydrolase